MVNVEKKCHPNYHFGFHYSWNTFITHLVDLWFSISSKLFNEKIKFYFLNKAEMESEIVPSSNNLSNMEV
jgi:hypothetical protein